ncbi:hypothetical protein AA313_de0204755 [Arthrobotrys entomopaga]|nr:hypothetical protein AA313_de0204755 [Arthrobotrys entomopaga]
MSRYQSSNQRRSRSGATNELPCLFQPSGRYRGLDSSFDQVPPYLFRTWAPQTNGSNDINFIRPAAVCNDQTSIDIFSYDYKFATQMLCDHIKWLNRADDNLTSWTSSLLYAVQLAQYRKKKDFKLPTNARNIYICVIDTRKFDRKTFLPAPDLLAAFSIPSEGKLTHSWSEGEYLSQGIVDIRGKSKVVTFQELLSYNLMDVFPPDIPENLLWYAVRDYRRTFREDIDIENAELKATLDMAFHCFGSEFYLAMVAMFLALKPRSVTDKQLMKIIYDEKEDGSLSDIEASLTKMKRRPNQPIEVMEYVRIMEALVAHGRKRESTSKKIAKSPAPNDDLDALSQSMGSFSKSSTFWKRRLIVGFSDEEREEAFYEMGLYRL